MQSLSICSAKGNGLEVPYLDSGLISSYFLIEGKSKKRRDVLREVSYNQGYVQFIASCNSSFMNGFSLDYSRTKFFGVCEKMNRNPVGASFALSGTLDGDSIGIEGMKEGSDSSMFRFPENFELDDDENEQILTVLEDREPVGEDCTNESELGNRTTSRVNVRALASSLQNVKDANDVENVLKDLKQVPLPVCSTIIRGFGMDRKLDCALALVEWLKRKKETDGSIGPNLFIYNSLLGAIKQSKRFVEVEKIMSDMKEEGITPNVVTFNTLMSIYVEQGFPSKALEVMIDIEKKGFQPSMASYSTALLAYRRMEDANGVLQLFIDVKDKHEKGELVKHGNENLKNEFVKLENFTIRICFQVMRRWLIKGEHLTTDVLKLFNEMDKAGLRPSRMEYERLVWACTLEGHLKVARELYKRIRERDNDISLSVCNHIIWLMGKAKKWWAALEVYEDLLDHGPKPNNLSYELIISHFNILLTAARKRGIWRWAVRLINKMQEKGLKPGSREWNSVLVACSKASETSSAVQIFSRMVEEGEKPTILSYGALLSALEKGKMYDEALRVWDHMCKVGVKPNLHAYTILISICIGQERIEKVDTVIREMTSFGIEPTVITYNAIISGCARNNLGSAAFEWFHRMKVKNIVPNEITYEMLIEALAKAAKPRLAYEMCLRAHNEGLSLSLKTYNTIIESSQVYGADIDLNVLGNTPLGKRQSSFGKKELETPRIEQEQ